MKVRVEMEMPSNCKECPFYYPGKEHDICYFPEQKSRLFGTNVDRPENCPLNDCVQVVACKVTHHHTTTDAPPEEGPRSHDDPFQYWNKQSYKSALQSGIGVVPTEILVRDSVPTRPYLFITQRQYELDPKEWKARITGLQAPESHLIIIPEFEYPKAEEPVQASADNQPGPYPPEDTRLSFCFRYRGTDGREYFVNTEVEQAAPAHPITRAELEEARAKAQKEVGSDVTLVPKSWCRFRSTEKVDKE